MQVAHKKRWKCSECFAKNASHLEECRVCLRPRFWVCACGIKRLSNLRICPNCRFEGTPSAQLESEALAAENYHLSQALELERKLLIEKEVELQDLQHQLYHLEEKVSRVPNLPSLAKTCQDLWKAEKELTQLRRKNRDLTECPVCLCEARDAVAECGHMACYQCLEKLRDCPLCRGKIGVIRKVFLF